jgi:CRP/FNR family transcriptional regulator, cyclic AMP receptor protein
LELDILDALREYKSKKHVPYDQVPALISLGGANRVFEMEPFDYDFDTPGTGIGLALLDGFDGPISQAAISTALLSVFRGKFCDAVLPNRKTRTYRRDQVIYDVGDKDRTLFFLRSGFVKVGTITFDGHELIYDVRTAGDVVGELCASEEIRPDRAVALEQSEAVPVPFEEMVNILRNQPQLMARLVSLFCRALKEAYAQVNTLAVDDTLRRLVNVLLRLGEKIGHNLGQSVELSTYLTQEELSHMVAARRERVSTALNFLRRKGAIHYTSPGRLVLNIQSLKTYIT